MPSKQTSREMRQYIRMDTVIPVEVICRKPDGPDTLLQGFTRDVSKGGMCVELNVLEPSSGAILSPRQDLELRISPPFSLKPLRVRCQVAWQSRDEDDILHYRVGVTYHEADGRGARKIWRHAIRRKWAPRIFGFFTVLLIGATLFLAYRQEGLIGENQRLVERLVASAKTEDQTPIQSLLELAGRERKLEKQIRVYQKRLREIASKPPLAGAMAPLVFDALEEERLSVQERRESLTQELAEVRAQSMSLGSKLSSLEKEYQSSRRQIIHQFYDWLHRHRHSKTGLVASYEGDPRLEDYSFTYDQALLVQAFSLFEDFEAARDILDFYEKKARRSNGAFLTGYDASSGRAMEWWVLAGPNIWMGIAALQYQKMSGDAAYQNLAVEIGNWLVALQYEDPEGGLRGGPEVHWFSTEHNLDAYAFYHMLFEITGKKKYLKAREDIFDWLMTHAADFERVSLRRGKGDATIATDTFSWSIAAVGPGRLSDVDFDPEGIMEFAEEHCKVTVPFRRPDGETVEITGFDFAKPRHIARGGIVSSEWTAQAIVTYQIMAEHFESQGKTEKAVFYRGKVYYYLHELQKMIISSLSRTGQGKGCLPYATQSDVDTGHGWRTPWGDRTGSVAGTAYGLFAWLGYNPFDLERAVPVPSRELSSRGGSAGAGEAISQK